MYGVDKHDQLRAVGGGFAKKSHFKKWYKKTLLGIFDMMLVNAYIAWHLSDQVKLTRHEFYYCVAEQMINYKEDNLCTPVVQRMHPNLSTPDAHTAQTPMNKEVKCAVCRIEHNILQTHHDKEKHKSVQHLRAGVATCTQCGISAHNTLPKNGDCASYYGTVIREKMEEFQSLTCFQIAHTKCGYELWKRTDKSNVAYYPDQTHKLYKELCKAHGVSEAATRKRKKRT